MKPDAELLAAYSSARSEDAFSELVERHAGLVYTTALRVGNGDEALAKDVAQQVFIDLARGARAVRLRGVSLGGWLYRHTFFTATKAVRTEGRRRARELEAGSMNPMNTEPQSVAVDLSGVLDQAMNRLSAQDRDAIVLRYFQQHDLKAVGAALGLSEDAAQKRVARAVERLRVVFARRGVLVSTAVLTSSLAGTVCVPVPAGFAALASTAAVTSAAGVGGVSVFSLLPFTPTPAGIAAAAIVTVLAVIAVFEHHANARLQRENEALNRLAAAAQERPIENARVFAAPELRASGTLPDLPAREVEAATRRALLHIDGDRRGRALSEIAERIAPTEIPQALDYLRRSGRLDVREALTEQLLKRWAKSDPKAALEHAQGIPPSRKQERAFAAVLDGWAQSHSDAALTWVIASPPSPGKGEMLAAVFDSVTQRSPAEAFAKLEALGNGEWTAWRLRERIVSAWAKEDPAAAAAAPGVSAESLGDIARQWGEVDPEAAVKWATSDSRAARNRYVASALSISLATVDPALAREFIDGLPPGAAKDGAMGGVALGLLERGTQEAVEWLKSLPPGTGRTKAALAVADDWAVADPKAATTFAASIADGDPGRMMLSMCLGSWSERSPESAAEWVRSQPHSEHTDMMNTVLLEHWTRKSPADAAAFVASTSDSGTRGEMLRSVVRAWAEVDAGSTIAWLDSFPEGEMRIDAANELARTLARTDPGHAESWLSGLKEGAERDQALAGYLETTRFEEPLSALELSLWVGNPQLRFAELTKTVDFWFLKQPATVDQWLRDSLPKLGEDEVRRLRERKKPRG